MLVNLKSWMNEEDSLNVFINWNEMFKSGIPLGFNGELPSQKIHQSSWKCLTDCLILRYKDLTYQSYSTLDVLWKTSTAMYFHGNWSEESSKVLRVSTTIYYSVQFSRSVVSDSLWLHGLRHARLPCPSPIPRDCSNSCPVSWWCHPSISSSVIPFSSCLQSFPASGSFPVSQFFTSGGQSIRISASASVLPMNIQDWFPLGWTGWISLQAKVFSRVFSNTTIKSINSSVLNFLYSPTLTSIRDYWKNHSFD